MATLCRRSKACHLKRLPDFSNIWPVSGHCQHIVVLYIYIYIYHIDTQSLVLRSWYEIPVWNFHATPYRLHSDLVNIQTLTPFVVKKYADPQRLRACSMPCFPPLRSREGWLRFLSPVEYGIPHSASRTSQSKSCTQNTVCFFDGPTLRGSYHTYVLNDSSSRVYPQATGWVLSVLSDSA